MLRALNYQCPGMDDVTRKLLRDVIIRYIREQPQTRHASAPYLIFLAMQEAFGCKRTRNLADRKAATDEVAIVLRARAVY
jgi:hypothetical protein